MHPRFDLQDIPPAMAGRSTIKKALDCLETPDRETPFLVIDAEKIRRKIRIIGRNLPGAEIYYAVKANPHPGILELLAEEGIGFEVASEGELAALLAAGVEPGRIISSNPMKTHHFLRVAAEAGLRLFAFDSRDEVDKTAALCPGASVYVRLAVPNEGSEWPLSRKFGVEIDEAAALLRYAAERGLDPAGLTFHVGSQCGNPYNWDTALHKSARLWELAERDGISLRLLNIGGGYPICYTRDVVQIPEIERRIRVSVEKLFPPGTRLLVEPGRAVVGDAGVFVSRVIGKARRMDEDWLYLDLGVFNGLMEAVGGIRYRYLTARRGPLRPWTVAGPSCDSFDVIDRNVELPEPEVGDPVLIPGCGAYTISYASEFNGFRIPETVFVQ